ncbi:MAG: EVE domain-containing protein [Planctomycetes bacterium]|nr:EVE domain-containing protein [Planctomycetota bacterium]
MPTWLFKTDPDTYSLADLEREGRATWDGVANNTALIHLRKTAPGDEVLIYHSGDDKAILGLARVVKGGYPDPKQKNPKLAVCDIEFVKRLATPVPLAAIKAEKALADFDLVRISRLSVMPVSPAHRAILKRLGVPAVAR